MPGQLLVRCYANRMAPGIGGDLHRDSDEPNHLTVIYYPNLTWSPRDAGETLFLDDAERDVIKAVAPHPNRLVVFRGTVPHVARRISALAGADRVTLMFKTTGRTSQIPITLHWAERAVIGN
jgi:SM-20-related protein